MVRPKTDPHFFLTRQIALGGREERARVVDPRAQRERVVRPVKVHEHVVQWRGRGTRPSCMRKKSQEMRDGG